MREDRERATEKKLELERLVKDTVIRDASISGEIVEKIIDSFCVIRPPEIEYTTGFMTMDAGGMGGGRSSKPGNIWLNWRKLVVGGAESILTAAGAVSIPWLVPLAGLVIWNKAWSVLNIEIDERHAVVIWNMWKNKDEEDCIEDEKILPLVNKELSRYNRPIMNAEELGRILKNLERMECIEKSEKEKWWLREWVKATYD
jgi:hypothetical protein